MKCYICGKDLTKSEKSEYVSLEDRTVCVKHPGVSDLIPKED
jgi:hypothetical protein